MNDAVLLLANQWVARKAVGEAVTLQRDLATAHRSLGCRIEPVMSNVCTHGTKSCQVKHAAPVDGWHGRFLDNYRISAGYASNVDSTNMLGEAVHEAFNATLAQYRVEVAGVVEEDPSQRFSFVLREPPSDIFKKSDVVFIELQRGVGCKVEAGIGAIAMTRSNAEDLIDQMRNSNSNSHSEELALFKEATRLRVPAKVFAAMRAAVPVLAQHPKSVAIDSGYAEIMMPIGYIEGPTPALVAHVLIEDPGCTIRAVEGIPQDGDD